MSVNGSELQERNEKIVRCINDLKVQRNDINYLIEKQQEEKIKLQTEIDRITYKLSLINKSLSQRMSTRSNYDKVIKCAESGYTQLIETSGVLLHTVEGDIKQLEEAMDKKVGTESKDTMPSKSSVHS